jgi:hypothetical protein
MLCRPTRRFRILKAQAMMEYLLVVVVVVAIVFTAFLNTNDSIIMRTQNKTAEYFDTGSQAIMGGYFNAQQGRFIESKIKPIDGGWCGWTTCVDGFKSRECACPRPAFGGKACDGESPHHGGSGEAVIDCL